MYILANESTDCQLFNRSFAVFTCGSGVDFRFKFAIYSSSTSSISNETFREPKHIEFLERLIERGKERKFACMLFGKFAWYFVTKNFLRDGGKKSTVITKT